MDEIEFIILRESITIKKNSFYFGKFISESFCKKLSKETKIEYDLLISSLIESCKRVRIDYELLRLIKELKKYTYVVLATGNMDCFNRWTVPILNLKNYFDKIINSYYKGYNKKDKCGQFFRDYAEKKRIPISKCYLIDNSKSTCEFFEKLGGTAFCVSDVEDTKFILKRLLVKFKPYKINDIALIAEYNWNFGGSQRTLRILSDILRKPIYAPFKRDNNELIIWNKRGIYGIPKEDIVLSIVVDKYNLNIIPNKINIKFCHSISTISNYYKKAKNVIFLTHRKRVYEYYKKKGLEIYLIPNGYTLYDKCDIKIAPDKKENMIIFISRINPDKFPVDLAKEFKKLNQKIVILCSRENTYYANNIFNILKGQKNVIIENPDLGFCFSEEKKFNLLSRSKILIHYSDGNYKDYLEYSLLDGMMTGNVPLCICNDKKQFDIIKTRKLGVVVRDISDLDKGIKEIYQKYNFYLNNIIDFMNHFIKDQPLLVSRWINTLKKILKLFQHPDI